MKKLLTLILTTTSLYSMDDAEDARWAQGVQNFNSMSHTALSMPKNAEIIGDIKMKIAGGTIAFRESWFERLTVYYGEKIHPILDEIVNDVILVSDQDVHQRVQAVIGYMLGEDFNVDNLTYDDAIPCAYFIVTKDGHPRIEDISQGESLIVNEDAPMVVDGGNYIPQRHGGTPLDIIWEYDADHDMYLGHTADDGYSQQYHDWLNGDRI